MALKSEWGRKNAGGVSRVDFCLGRVGVQVRLNMNSNKAVQHVSLQVLGTILTFFWTLDQKGEAGSASQIECDCCVGFKFSRLCSLQAVVLLFSATSLSLLGSPLTNSAICESVKAAGFGRRASLAGVPDIVF
jgi:hypothetical protein